MPVENATLNFYALGLFLGGLCCLVHFVFFFNRPKRIDPANGLAAWPLTFVEFLAGLLSIIFAALLAQIFATDLAPESWLEAGTPKRIVLLSSAMNLTALAMLFGLTKVYAEKFQKPFFDKKMGWLRALLTGLYGFLVLVPLLYPLTLGWSVLLEQFGFKPQTQDAVRIFSEVETGFVLILMILVTVVLAPVTEEIFFRGCLYRFIKGKIGLLPALFGSGLLFALLHHNFLSLLPLLFLGIALAYAYELSGDIKVPILLHAVFNLNTVTIIILEHDLL